MCTWSYLFRQTRSHAHLPFTHSILHTSTLIHHSHCIRLLNKNNGPLSHSHPQPYIHMFPPWSLFLHETEYNILNAIRLKRRILFCMEISWSQNKMYSMCLFATVKEKSLVYPGMTTTHSILSAHILSPSPLSLYARDMWLMYLALGLIDLLQQRVVPFKTNLFS